MTQILIDFPDSLFKGAEALAQKEKISIEQLVTAALGEKLATSMTEDYLAQRAKKGRRDVFLSVLDMASNVDPLEDDKI